MLVVPCCANKSRFCVNKCSGHFWARKQVTESCMSCYFLLADLPCMTPMHVAIRVSRTRIGRYHLFARPANVLEDLGFDAGAANGSRSVCSLMTSHDASSLLMCWLHNSLNFVWTEGHAAKKVLGTMRHETIQTHNPFGFEKGNASNPKLPKTLGCLNQHDKSPYIYYNFI